MTQGRRISEGRRVRSRREAREKRQVIVSLYLCLYPEWRNKPQAKSLKKGALALVFTVKGGIRYKAVRDND